MNTTKHKSYALPIAIMFALFFMVAFVTGLQNPMGVIVKSQFGASNFLSQLGNLANFVAYFCLGIPSGILLQKLGYKKTALAAVVTGFVGVGVTYLSGSVESFSVYLVGAFISGFSMCMLNTVVNPMLNTLGGGGNTGNQLIQFGGSCNSIGATIVPVLVGYLMGSDPATRTIASAGPALFLAMGIFVLAFIVLYFAAIPEPQVEAENDSVVADIKGAVSFRHFVMGIIAIFLYVGVEVGIPNIGNLFMTTPTAQQIQDKETEFAKQQSDAQYVANIDVEQLINQKEIDTLRAIKVPGLGMDSTIAGTIVGTYWFLMLIGRLLGGILGAKVSARTMLTSVTTLGMVFILAAMFVSSESTVNMPVFQSDISFGMAEVPMSVMFMILCGLCTSVMWGGIFNLATAGLGRYTAIASGIFMTMVVGGGVLPIIQGGVADAFGYISSYWVVFAGIAYIFFYAVAGSRHKEA